MLKKGYILYSFLGLAITSASVGGAILSEQQWNRTCDGIEVASNCTAEDGVRYSKYIFHEEQQEVTEVVNHPATPAQTHVVHHPPTYGTRKVISDCIRTNISYKGGTCALSRCRDGKYSGSTGWGTCNYHGGVWYGGGPWYTYREESYVVKPAWDETVVDVPAKEAWNETIIVIPHGDAYYERVEA